tara:strand:- start:700 stop:1575 length:876 start_codon:yes stop_codon:yes gene_type:complete
MLKKICSNEVSHKNSKFYCEKCDYSCDKLFLFKQHCSTKKHNRKKCSKCSKKYADAYTCACGKEYKHIQSFKRHERNCKAAASTIQADTEKEDLKSMVSLLITQNQNMLMENNEMREMVKDMIPKIGNTTINNKFNLNLFLNEQCKDAINLTEFIDTLNLELIDLDNTRQQGYVNGIANIFIRGLKELELHKRPIHCSDYKREILYVKDNDAWEKDNEDKTIMKHAITNLAKRQIDKIKEWEHQNPEWNKTEDGRNNYIRMVQMLTDCEDSKCDNKIIKTIAKEVVIDKET